jgi:hypothetical protein
MTIRAGIPGDWIFNEENFGKTITTRQLQEWQNIWWRVAVLHIPPRDQRFDFFREMGSGLIDKVFAHQPLGVHRIKEGGQRLFFVFPERHMTTQEEYYFLQRLQTHPDIVSAKLSIIDIVTKSPLIIGSLLKQDVRIITAEEWPGGLPLGLQEAMDAERKSHAA